MILENIVIDIDMVTLENIDIDKISNRLKFGISNRARWQPRAGAIAAVPLNSNQLCHHSKEHIYRKLRASQFLIFMSFENLSSFTLIWAPYLWACYVRLLV